MAKDVSYKLSLDAKGFSAGVKEAKGQFNSLVTDVAADSGKLGEVLSAIGPAGVLIAATAGAVVMLGKATFDAAAKAVDFAGKISDLSTKSGIGGEALQKLAYAGSLVGTQLEDVTTAVMKLQEHMVKAPEDFAQLGLSMKELKKLAPEKQFEEVGRAILAIQDPAQRTAATIAFMGKGGQEALKLLSLDLKATGDEAERLGNVMHDDTRVALDSLGDSVTTLSTTWDHLVMNWGGSIAQIPEIQQLVKDLTEKLGEMSRWVLANKDQIGEYAKEAIAWGKDFASAIASIGAALIKFKNSDAYKVLSLLNAPVRMALTGGGLGDAFSGFSNWAGWSGGEGGQSLAGQWNSNLAPGLGWGAPAAGGSKPGGHPPGWIDPAEVTKNRAEIARIHKVADDAMTKLRVDAIKIVNDKLKNEYERNVKVITQILETGADQERQIAQHRAEIYKALSEQFALGQRNAQIWREMEARGLEISAAKWSTYGAAATLVGQNIQGPVGGALQGLGGIFGGLSANTQRSADNLRLHGTTAMTTGQKVMAAAQAVATLSAAFEHGKQSADKWGGAMSGALSGAATGASIAGGWGALVGGILGGAAGYAGGKQGQAEQLAQLQKQFNDLQAQAKAAGITIADALHPNSAVWLKSQIADITLALGLQQEAQKGVQDAMDRWGITVEQMGPAWQKQELDKQFAQYLQDWELLKAAGADHLAMMDKMGPALGGYMDAAITAGIEIPKAMKPVIDDLYAQGKLVHANGTAFTEEEYNALHFGATTGEMFDTLIKKIDDLVSALLGIPNVNRTVTVHTVHTGGTTAGEGEGSGNASGGGENGGETQLATGGIVRARSGGTRVVLGEGGDDEAVIPLSRLRTAGGGGDSGAVLAELRQLNRYLRQMPHALATATRDAVVKGKA